MKNQTSILSNDQLLSAAPAIFAESPHPIVSERYGMIRTIDVVDALRDEGWYPVAASQPQGQTLEREQSNRHIIRFRQPNKRVKKVGDTVPEIVLLNSHNRATTYQLHAGLFRLVCSNGLIVSDATFAHRSYRHTPNVIDDVIEGTYEVLEELPAIENQVGRFQATFLSNQDKLELGNRALALAYDAPTIEPEQVITTRRFEDRRNTLWNTFNVIQENLIRGGLEGKSTTGRRTQTRGFTNVRKNVSLNKDLWELAEQFYQEKKAA